MSKEHNCYSANVHDDNSYSTSQSDSSASDSDSDQQDKEFSIRESNFKEGRLTLKISATRRSLTLQAEPGSGLTQTESVESEYKTIDISDKLKDTYSENLPNPSVIQAQDKQVFAFFLYL